MKTLLICIISLFFVNSNKLKTSSFRITVDGFGNNGRMSKKYVASILTNRPIVKWNGIPEGTKSLALVLRDPDAPKKPYFYHWIVVDIAPNNINGNVVGNELETSWGDQITYRGPDPPAGKPHRYEFILYALECEHINDISEINQCGIKGEAKYTGIYTKIN